MKVVGIHIRVVGIHIRVVGIHIRAVCIHMRVVGIHIRAVGIHRIENSIPRNEYESWECTALWEWVSAVACFAGGGGVGMCFLG